jgi:tyrosine-protein kinase Etk/Wzc
MMNDNNYSEIKKEKSSESFILFLSILWKQRKLLVRNFVIASLIFVGISLLMPKTYKATTTLMPPVSDLNMGMLGMAMASSPLSAFMGNGGNSETMSTISILQSRTLAERTVDNFNLMDYYDVEKKEEALKIFSESSAIGIDDEGTIRVEFYLSTTWFSSKENDVITKNLVADICNYMAQELDSLNTQLKTEQARFNRLFIEERYMQNKEDLRIAEEQMREFQKKYNMVALAEQTSATIEAAATVQAQIIAGEVKIQTMLNSLNADNPELRSLQKEVETLNEKLVDLEEGRNISEIFPGFKSVPDLGVAYGRLLREIEIQNTIFTFLTQQYEEAKIQEAKDTPTVQVLDPAVAPWKKARPRRSLFVLFWVTTVMLGSMIYVNYKPVIKQIASDIIKR